MDACMTVAAIRIAHEDVSLNALFLEAVPASSRTGQNQKQTCM
ncbi:Unknown protein sequence [Pseudomonas amygdali pv. eriobotryae]|uniref:Uncharacterized protein n=1 Tax=Pseudomonas amygdali pv. eriobotryae TaxID=129137 RepID=A0A0P9VB71_PSEA0|nr:Unknown protein sequence [Pseudomonas amygdali pv. eriobotryae]